MKVRVIKEMPFAEVGDVLEKKNDCFASHYKYGYLHMFDQKSVNEMLEDGWLEEVKEEKTLKDKIKSWFIQSHGEYSSGKAWRDAAEIAMCCIAKAHYREVIENKSDECMAGGMTPLVQSILLRAVEKA